MSDSAYDSGRRRYGELVDLEAEREVLGSVFVKPQLLGELTLSTADFYPERHQLIWAAMADAVANGMAVDLASVAHCLKRAGAFEKVGGFRGIGEACERRGLSFNVGHYAAVMREKALDRRMLDVQQHLGTAIARNEQEAVAQHLDEIQALNRERAELGAELPLRSMGEIGGVEDNWLESAPPAARVLLTNERGAPYMRDGRVALLSAPGGTGKSYALVDLALSIASGRAWLDTYRPVRKGKVLLALGEEEMDEVRRRIWSAARHRLSEYEAGEALRNVVPLGLAGKEIEFLRKTRDGSLVPTAWYETLRSRLTRSGPWRAILLDPWSRFGGQDVETDNHAATRGVQCLERLTRLPGEPAVVVSTHDRKSLAGSKPARDASNTRGASALVDGARLVISLSRRSKGELLELRVNKANYTVAGAPLVLKRTESGALRAATEREIDEDREAGAKEEAR